MVKPLLSFFMKILGPSKPATPRRARPASRPAPRPAPIEPAKSRSGLAYPIYLQVRGSEQGPMNETQLLGFLGRQKLEDQIYVYAPGMETWRPLQWVPGFTDLRFSRSEMRPTKPEGEESLIYRKEQRNSNRIRFPATISVFSPSTGVGEFGVCVDASTTGLRVRLESPCALRAGNKVDLDLFPGSFTGFPPFRGEGKLVWTNASRLEIGISFTKIEGRTWDRFRNQF